jgi:hypothetical protein
MSKYEIPSPELLRKLLRYEPETGEIFWRERPDAPTWWNARYAGKRALTALDKDGYRKGRINEAYCKAHRVIWAMQTGAWPSGKIDHVNNNPRDNRMENLREASDAENARNRKSHTGSSSKYLGVSKIKNKGTWRAAIYIDGRLNFLGVFSCEIAAAKAYDEQAKKHFGKFANPNFP